MLKRFKFDYKKGSKKVTDDLLLLIQKKTDTLIDQKRQDHKKLFNSK